MKQDHYEEIVNYIVDNQQTFYRLVYSYVRNETDALDVIQNAICKALENYKSIRNIKYLKTWFYRVLVNESIQFIKNNKKEIPGINMKELYYENSYEESGDFYDRVNQLPIEVQTVIKLKFYEEFTLKEIAKCTDTNINTVKARLYRGLKRLKEEVAL